MTQKITLSIPDLLHEKLKEWRSSFNFSKMFQEAVTDAIQRKEEFQKRFKQEFDMQEVIHRLKAEKTAWENQFYKKGKLEGMRWASSAHYQDLMHVLHFEGTYDITSDETMREYFTQIYRDAELEKYAGTDSVFHEQKFLDGWHSGVSDFWNQVKGELQDE